MSTQPRAWAPGGRLETPEALDDIRDRDALYNELPTEYGLSTRHMQRICQGQHWREGWKPRRIPNEFKTCIICGESFARRCDNGRLRAPRVWARMSTCSHRCKLLHQWSVGDYENRGKR